MAGTTQTIKRFWGKVTSSTSNFVIDGMRAFYEQHNNIITDLETLRGATGVGSVIYQHEDLAAGADIAARAIFVAPAALTILDSVKYIPQANSAGIDAGNTLVLTLRNITEGVDIATITRAASGGLTANTPIALTLTAANADIAASDVLGIVVTQGATADVGTGVFQFNHQRQVTDATSDLVASAIATVES